jgi:type II secretory pathway pseudopilin PulG
MTRLILEESNKGRRQIPIEGKGFTVVEVIVAASIMIILCVGTLSVFSYVVKVNRGENLRAQALTVLQKQVECYRSLKFIPIGSSTLLNGKTATNISLNDQCAQASTVTSADGRVFVISVTIDNDPYTTGIQTAGDTTTRFKEIAITATPQITETGWLANLQTTVTIQRVRSN